jgi:hypothetical protein
VALAEKAVPVIGPFLMTGECGSQMEFSRKPAVISGVSKQFGNELDIIGERSGSIGVHMNQSGILPAEKACPAGLTYRTLAICFRKTDPFTCKPV